MAELGWVTREQAEAAKPRTSRSTAARRARTSTTPTISSRRSAARARPVRRGQARRRLLSCAPRSTRACRASRARALMDGLETFDRRHGWRGPVTQIDMPALGGGVGKMTSPADIAPWRLGVVLEIAEDQGRRRPAAETPAGRTLAGRSARRSRSPSTRSKSAATATVAARDPRRRRCADRSATSSSWRRRTPTNCAGAWSLMQVPRGQRRAGGHGPGHRPRAGRWSAATPSP